MPRRLTAVIAVLLSFALVSAGCSGPATQWITPRTTSSVTPGATAPTVKWTDCTDVAKSLVGTPPAGISYDCGSIDVPEDWATAKDGKATDGKTMSIALLRARSSRQTNRIGSLIINPGGPGASGVNYAVYLSALSGINTRFDIVGFDPRGVGRSTQIKCFSDADLDTSFGYDPDPVSQAQFDGYVALNRRMNDGCATKYGESLRVFSTEQTARDMDAVRAAVGDPKITYLGYSYGTLLGGVYAELFPTNIRAMVLDGAIDPQADAVARSQSQAQGFERAFDNFALWCKENADSCPIGPDARASVNAVLRTARQQPITGSGGRDATAGWIFTGVVASLYVKEYWPQLAKAIDALRHQDAQAIFALADSYADRDANGHFDNLFDANAAVNCADYESYPDLQKVRTLQSQWRTKYPLFGAPLAMGMIGCAVWPAKHDPFPIGPATGSPPIVVIGTTGDPATPYEQTAKLAKMLGTGQVLTWEGEGHTAYPHTTCIVQAVNHYLIDLVPPPANQVCPAK